MTPRPSDETAATMIRRDEEHLGQYATRQRAQRAARTGRRGHRIILTTCYRCDADGYPVSRLCWATYLDMGLLDAQKRAWSGQ